MGSTISGIHAELKLRKLEKNVKIKFNNRMRVWLTLIDNIFVILEKGYR